jgi:hypothetical protein
LSPRTIFRIASIPAFTSTAILLLRDQKAPAMIGRKYLP